MATGKNIRTWFEGKWHDGNVPIMNAADHGSWLGGTVFDGARYAHGLAPDLLAHCERVNRSAKALMMNPTHTGQEIYDIVWEGIRLYPEDTPLYIRPMYWTIDGGYSAIVPNADSTGFAVCLEEIPLSPPDATVRLGTTQFRRPVLADNVTNAKAGCLYPNNARMLAEVRAKGFDNALVADAMGNVAESATANVFIVKDGVVKTPIPNGTFLSGITRARHIKNLRDAGHEVREEVLSFDDVRDADEVFLSGNMSKVTPVVEFDGTNYQVGPVTKEALKLYWDWAKSEG
ncbi:branched-chain amino acid aminotransferase [Nioella sp. MMSF_3534]|uniref:branched-chain amino acid aminotransferase n=1 Tax=Nioella sp. MMSF_3534 TaxID=3046720 RepID=UPI00273D1A95|nr:branched-chain amino acid aminotransferase [Nioella sp. MMSF_3534]